ncbi:hypothetical protein Acr_00g0096270 [Actinidia rufa]|uniref:Elongin-A n=1 Tax=Actinidia rufa TaxID=165716 RepID=A0A7J0DZ78_9ERIC|nr:hypothetical protein Acr_00g0096270 [Actinidia rufa]
MLIFQLKGHLRRRAAQDTYIFERYMMIKRKAPSLVDLCVQLAVDNIRYLGDVGETDLHLLDRILPHCTVDQLRHIEDLTEGRDLSPVTDKLWKNFYELQFGAKSTNLVIDRMKQKKVSFKWKKLYEAKLKDLEECQQKSFDRIKELYKKEDARGPGGCISNTKSNIMKKAKLQFLNSLSSMRKPGVFSGNNSASTSKPTGRRF